jgi:putative ABC transport system ATP-binding protein
MASRRAPVIEARDIHKTFELGSIQVRALRGVSLRVDRGEFVAVMGTSGSGKSTLMNILGCLDIPTSGTYRLGGIDVRDFNADELSEIRNRFIGFVFQSYNLIPNLSSTENVMLPMEFAGVGKDERRQRARSLLDQVELTGGKQHRRPGKLSGGEQQRVAIARALANSPKLILADEPVGNLDTQTSGTVIGLLRSLAHARGTTVVAVTHDLLLADRADRVFRLHDGRLQAAGGSGPAPSAAAAEARESGR